MKEKNQTENELIKYCPACGQRLSNLHKVSFVIEVKGKYLEEDYQNDNDEYAEPVHRSWIDATHETDILDEISKGEVVDYYCENCDK